MTNLSRAALLFIWVGIILPGFIFAAEKIDINTASLEDLVRIRHIGEVRALEIISLRPFYSLDELTKIKGIGEKRLEDIKKQGLAWVSTIGLEPKIEPEPSLESSSAKTPGEKTLSEPKEEVEIIYPSGIIINEILPNTAVGIKDEEGEYIEIFNQNNFEVDLSDWKIEDTMGRTTTHTFPKGTKIEPRGFLVLYRPFTKITLNNDGDGLNLFQPDGKIADIVTYEKAPAGQSYNRIPLEPSNEGLTGQAPSGWVWSTNLTPGSENIISTQKTEGIEPPTKTLVGGEESGKIDINTASVKELQEITGIGPVLAQRIIDARPFYSLDELSKVSGIGPKTLEDIKKQGLAWVDPKLTPSKIGEPESPERGVAAVAEPLKQTSKSLSVFLIALSLAIFSGTIIFILKKKLKAEKL